MKIGRNAMNCVGFLVYLCERTINKFVCLQCVEKMQRVDIFVMPHYSEERAYDLGLVKSGKVTARLTIQARVFPGLHELIYVERLRSLEPSPQSPSRVAPPIKARNIGSMTVNVMSRKTNQKNICL